MYFFKRGDKEMSLKKISISKNEANEIVNALEYFVSNMPLKEQSLKNYWGLIRKFKGLFYYDQRKVN